MPALTWSDPTTLVWAAVGGAYGYTVHRAGNNLGFDTCLATEIAETELTESDLPQSGEMFAYLASAVGTCGSGSVGTGSNNTPRTSVVCNPQ